MKLKSLGALLTFALLPIEAQAVPLSEPVPTGNYVTIDGLDWAWAAPCNAFGQSCSPVDMTYQSTQGWHIASVEEVSTYILSDLPSFLANFGTSSDFKCAAAWFSTRFTHCDWFDAQAWAIYNASVPDAYSEANESFAVRSVTAVPIPAGALFLLSAIGAITALCRRKSI